MIGLKNHYKVSRKTPVLIQQVGKEYINNISVLLEKNYDV